MKLGVTSFEQDLKRVRAGMDLISIVPGPVPNVKGLAYGAVGDGIADDSGAVQDALDASSGTIYFPSGQYRCANPVQKGGRIVINAGTTLDFRDAGGYLVVPRGTGSTDGPLFRVINTTTAPDSLVYGLFMITDTEFVDTAAALAVRNIGHSDSIYLELSGKPGTAVSQPTGLGIDLNKAAGSSGQSSTQMSGFGIQIYDHSTTNQGVNGPHMIYLWKSGNMNTEHPCLEIAANRHAIRVIDDPGISGYSGVEGLISHWRADTGAERWRVTAEGSFLFLETGKGILFNFASGAQGALKWDKAGLTVDLLGGTSGLRVLNNAGSAVNVHFQDSGNVVTRGNLDVGTYIRTRGVNGPRVDMRQLTIANDGIATVAWTNSFFGWVFVQCIQTGNAAIYFCRGGGNSTAEINDFSGQFTPTAGNVGTTNIYYSAPDTAYIIQNRMGGTRDYEIALLGR